MERTAQNHPAERRRKGQRPAAGALSFDEPREPLTFDEPDADPAPAAAPDAAGDA
jgi:hypothetical protein